MTDSPDRKIEYYETGSGAPVLFVPGSFSTSVAWRSMQKCLPDGYRCIGTSICGYGETSETRSGDDFDIAHEVAVIEMAAQRIGSPIHLVGHSFGGTVALAAALSGRIDVRSLATFEANPLNLMREHGDIDLYESVQRMAADFEEAHDAGERDAAARIIDFWGGTGSFAALPESVQDYCRQTAAANVLDWHTCFGFTLTRQDLSRLGIPVLIVRGGLANPAMVVISGVLDEGLPKSRQEVVEGASHFLISTHPSECAELLSGFLAANSG
ncbi:alpha/beta fold hydrolase [Roseibium sp. MMSF_3544]|uniref:alpha/beta fold hydrolase n=1 Tax=unclassified Roseibium TaxID=2629323 RepID=UPI00273DF90D|nr:alpha/beta hydrolase [Roseibium sp. MMSF_3544]